MISYTISTPLSFNNWSDTLDVSATELTEISVMALVLLDGPISIVNFRIIPVSCKFFTLRRTADSDIPIEFAISTNQLDFLATKTFDLSYIGEDGTEQPVYVIHRAPLGSHERFVAFLLEHYAGNFPVWLSPTQVRVIPIADRHIDYARKVEKELKDLYARNSNGAPRIDSDTSSERMQKKIRAAQMMKIPYMLVVGDKEQEEGTVAVRHRSGSDLGAMKLDRMNGILPPERHSAHMSFHPP